MYKCESCRSTNVNFYEDEIGAHLYCYDCGKISFLCTKHFKNRLFDEIIEKQHNKGINDIVIIDENLISSRIKNSIRDMRRDGHNFLEIGYVLTTLIHDCLYDIEQEEIYDV